jgi:hypothetical protein
MKRHTPRLNGKAERSHRIYEEESYGLLVGVVIDDARPFSSKLQDWEDYCGPAVLVQKVHMNVSYVSGTMVDHG